ncbi:gliding motility-associated C-terminal domain-containing protein [Cecembia rubra]|uniref:CHU domain-containing protein n=1 Tax=Cecembia rubra TaxID=1485585 RepID=A0A2P8DZF8_9BACT|nr:gliding motility-associated C-terminal domain-containing protein [Cecembia rubra]PSL02602.1 CHU domain-containing protein [Cecembia rubra]
MKTSTNYINIHLFFFFLSLIFCLSAIQNTSAQGFNNNQWIFGYCESDQENSYLSFGRGEDPVVRTLPGNVIVGQNNNAIAIDPISGNTIFYTNGELIYDGDNEPMEGMAPGINGDFEGRQKVAIGTLSYDPLGDRLFYVFYLSPTGQLQYAVIDMNAPGQALPNQPPLGQVIDKNITIANGASGAILVVKTPQSSSYLISFSNGQLVSRRIEPTQGDFTESGNVSFPFTPKAIVFEESTGKLILIPENAGDDIAVVDFDASTGSFGSISTVSQSGGTDAIEGGAISPDGQFLYFSRGNQLLRVPINDLDAEPEVMPIEVIVDRIFDVKVGPDGRLYYIYEETVGGPQLIGRVNNPNETDLDELDIEEDPFNGTDFCGRVFPQFAPNQDINPQVDFTWEPEEPCSNNPIQLTSVITPENYRPVSFEWTFNPPLTDEDGQPIDIDFNQEHLLIPEEATANQSIQVTLTVTFADGNTVTVPKTIRLTENNLQANFSAQDTTVCEGACVDIGSLLEVQQGGGQGGQAPGVGGGQGGNYEYFWSNRREEGWVQDQNNCVDRPGLYWVLVREQGSDCYAYAEIRVRIWDLPDQSNNIWYFGNGAGLDFNPDPDDPNAPVPRPVSHNQNIPAGTTTISDETGQVLFFTDGESVWDLNGDLMNNGENIGGNNQASEGVIAVPVPQNQTIFYVFTSQRAADGSNRVSYSVVDIKTDNPTGVGSVVTKNNFLFSPSTEHSAALASGDTTWVLFHELGNNTFRAYPVSQFGIGQPVFSSVGSNHGFNTGVGSMKFSPDGSQVAVTIQDGNCSRLEIFNFNQSTGRLTEYAQLDLGCTGEEIYGLEFSNDGSRVFVSFSGSPGKIEEYLIKRPDSAIQGEDLDTNLSCFDCFNNANTRAQRESCILATRNVLSTSGPFGALQVGPDGQIYVARPGANEITTINPGVNCIDSFYSEQGIILSPGTSMTLGLPAFVQQSGSSIPEPALAGPERICYDPEFGALALFEGGGEPDIDSYFWTIVHEDGEVIISELGGPGEQFQNLEQSLPRAGIYTVTLRVDRCGDPEYFREEIVVEVVDAPEITLPDEFTLCVGNPVQLTAIDGYDPAEGLYDFEWRNAAGQLIGDQNSNTIEVSEESIYTVTVRYRVPEGLTEAEFDVCPASKSVFVGPAFDFDLTQSAEEVCYDEPLVVFAPNTPISGEWFYRPAGSPNRVSLGVAFELELIPSTLPSPGEYEIVFLAEDPLVEGCFVEKVAPLTIFPLPEVEVVILADSDDCVNPNGSFTITALSSIQSLEVMELGQSYGPLAAGESLPPFTDLEPGLYTLQLRNEFNCEFVQSVTIRNLNPPQGIEGYEVTSVSETCDVQVVQEGQIVISFANGPVSGTYQIVRQGDGAVFSDSFTNSEQISVNVPAGIYAVEVEDENGCSVPFDQLLEVEQVNFVDFTVPSNVEACGTFVFTPQSPDQLVYTLRNNSGNTIQANQDGSFTLTETGNYFILGEDPSGVDCSLEREINLVIIAPPVFNLVGPRIDCDLGIYYEAVLGPNEDPNQVFIFWLDSNSRVVSRNPLFFPRATGEYFLEVQPRTGALCENQSISFIVDDITPEINVELVAEPFCADDPFTIISIIADLSDVARVEWYEIVNGERVSQQNWLGLEDVVVLENGIFEVLLINGDGCVVGSDQIEIIQSTIIPPVLESRYEICAPEGVTFEINPGEYPNYSWQLGDEEVSNSPTFTPVIPGQYVLIVSDDQGCEFVVRFDVVENCEIGVRIPNAIILGDEERNFRIFPTEFVDELEVFIYNRWGELIFYCENSNINGETELCTWDGIVNGRFVPIGSYPVVVNYGSTRQNVKRTLKSAIVVIQ